MELDYKRPTTMQISKRMLSIAADRGLQVNEATMNALVEGANGDLRAILGQLQMVRLRKRTLAYNDVKGKMGTSKARTPLFSNRVFVRV
jgi:replication factor C subunit 1